MEISGRPVVSGGCDRPRNRVAAVLSLLAVLLAAVALNVSGTFLIAKQVSASSVIQTAYVLDHHQERLSQDTDRDDDLIPSAGPKRVRATLERTVPGIVFDSPGASLTNFVLIIPEIETGSAPVSAGEFKLPDYYRLSQETLSRPPPRG